MFQHPALQGAQQALKQFQTAPAGRPKANLRPLMLKSTDRLASGWTFVNDTPAPIQAAMDKYLKAGQLPPGLSPKLTTGLRPQISEQHRANQISKGWKHPGTRY